MRLLFTLTALTLGFAIPVLAEEKTTIDPEVRQQIEAELKKFDEAYNKNDAAAVAALFTPDAVEVLAWESEGGVASGHEAIEKRYGVYMAGSMNNSASNLVQAYPMGSEVCAVTKWSAAPWKGYATAVYVRDAELWKIRLRYAISSMTP